MTEPSAQHATFVIERRYPASTARVFAAWADPVAKRRWFKGPEAQRDEGYELDFRVGGRERLRVHGSDRKIHAYDCQYMDIVPGARIVYCYDMHIAEARISVSLATVTFEAEGKGTLMTFTEQVVFLDGYDDSGSRERGTTALLDQLASRGRR